MKLSEPKLHKASPKLLTFTSIMLTVAMGGCWVIYPGMFFSTSQIGPVIWAVSLSLAAATALTLLFAVLKYGWLTIRGRCHPFLFLAALGMTAGFIVAGLSYYRFIERMP